MRKLFAIAALIFIATITVGCLDQAEKPTVSAAATSTLKLTAPAVVNRSEYTTFSCQLNMTHGSGLDDKEIRWSIDNVYKETSRTIWGFAALNLTLDQTQELTTGKHVITATFPGDYDYTSSNATTTFSVQTAAAPTPSKATALPNAEKPSITLDAPQTVDSKKTPNASLTGTFSGKLNNQNIYVLVKQAGADQYTVYAPLLEASGNYQVDLSLTTKGNAELVAIITTSTLTTGGNVKNLPATLAKSSASTMVT
ncbi:MAG: hypothetical protein LUQ34_03120 [Euryarchaeota archaeon]|nr:hypothetical protein [Euryarchaeota archaeon]